MPRAIGTKTVPMILLSFVQTGEPFKKEYCATNYWLIYILAYITVLWFLILKTCLNTEIYNVCFESGSHIGNNLAPKH